MAGKTDTERRLLEAMLKVASEVGYARATTRRIAQEARVAELTLFRRFGSKQELFRQMLRTYGFLPRLRQVLAGLQNVQPRPALRSVGLRYIATLKERKALVKVILSEISTQPGALRGVYVELIEQMVDLLAGYLRRHRQELRRPLRARRAARAFLGMIFSYFLSEEILKNRTIGARQMQEAVGNMVEIFLRGIQRP
jgi:AcrR family transcriptional regulator